MRHDIATHVCLSIHPSLGRLARHSGPESKTPCPYVRLSFVTAKEEELEVAIQRLAALLRSLQGQEKPPIPALSPTKLPSKPVAQAEVL